MMNKPWLCHFLSLLILAVGFVIGQNVAWHKPLWTDEIFTQVSTNEGRSYLDIVCLRTEEGNRCPLFFLIQKAAMEALHFRLPFAWQREGFVVHRLSQEMMRLPAVVFMSLAIALMFWFFCRYYSVAAGVLVFLMALASIVVWFYWAEARAYSFWMLLTTCQTLLLLKMFMEEGRPRKALWHMLTVIHLALCLTILYGAAQVFLAAAVLRLWKGVPVRSFLWTALVPTLFSVMIFFNTPRLAAVYPVGIPESQVLVNFPPERLALVAIFCLFLILAGHLKLLVTRDVAWAAAERLKPFFFFALAMFLGGWGMMLVFKAMAAGKGTFCLVRYFVFLTPVAIIATSLVLVHAWRISRCYPWCRWGMVVGAAGIFLMGASEIVIVLLGYNFLNLR
jgi:hypothetical protein